MKCEDARERWNRRWDNGVVDAQLDGHLDQCEACRRYSDEMSRVTHMLDQVGHDTDSIVSHRSAEPVVPMRGTFFRTVDRRVKPMIAMAAAMAIVVSAYMYFTAESPGTADVPTVALKSTTPLGITLRGEIADRYVVVSKPVTQANVQVFWLYPTLK